MFKLDENYIISINDKELGNVKILGIVNKRNTKFKKRIHRINKKFNVIKMS